jgi:thiamine pyrophosphokinase
MKNFDRKKFDIVIFANGEKPSNEIPISITRNTRYAVCCDGALQKMRELGREPDFVVGDCDSLSAETIAELGSCLVKITEQETNDLSKAFHFAIKHFNIDNPSIAIIGATGLREDHSVGNIFHLIDFSSIAPDVTIVSDYGCFIAVRGEQTFSHYPNKAVSIFAPFPNTKIISSGLLWPLEGVELKYLWSGTLNKTDSETISLNTNNPIVVYFPF